MGSQCTVSFTDINQLVVGNPLFENEANLVEVANVLKAAATDEFADMEKNVKKYIDLQVIANDIKAVEARVTNEVNYHCVAFRCRKIRFAELFFHVIVSLSLSI